MPNDEQGIHFSLFVNDTLNSVVSLFIENKKAQFRKLATASLEQDKAFGSRLLSHLISYAVGKKSQQSRRQCACGQKEFYLKFGFKSTNTVFTKHKIDYMVMEKMIIR
ncbi:GNAT family N-acetyltransferase [Arenibacter sp. F26102]|uniref:GNAT family N-acetyltransferase n=1 Tax=Arenibacter sp. F26102 TaxID=2926416 RepID=UPI001FF3C43B|nr:GNAT family N-acetyltransferase [Arenibacter sp. F26102]MCK0145528.1 GNAT family N-acetyltransferase [Arenibacter sp. F26102]